LIKQSQHLIDLINVLPLQSIQSGLNTILSSKEANALLEVWNKNTDSQNFTIPADIDPLLISALTAKGIITDKLSTRIGHNGMLTRVVEITGKGRALIRNMILQSEKSAFEATKRAASGQQIKTASVHAPANWLQRSIGI
jgi:hypothetical protein